MSAVAQAGEVDLERVGLRVEQLLDEIAAADPTAADAGSELVRELLALYGAGLARILAVVDELAPGVAPRLAEDPLLAGLLTLHDLHPVDVVTRIERALDEVRPYLGSHGGDVELVDVTGDVAHLRLIGSCNGCGASASTLETAVEGAIRNAAPEVASLQVEGAVDPAANNDGLIPLSSLSIRRDVSGEATNGRGTDDAGSWRTLDASQVTGDCLTVRECGGHRLVLGRVGTDLYAYRERCPSCAASLAGAVIDAGVVRCRGCGLGYDVRLAGRGVEDDGPGLEPVALIEGADGVRVALGGIA